MNLFLELRRHGKLGQKRHPMFEKNKYAMLWIYISYIFWAGYLILFGTMFAFAFDGASKEPYHYINSVLPIFLCLDFVLRMPLQKTPTQEVKPYLLLPIPRKRLIDFLLIRSGMSGFNAIFLFFFVPFAILTITKFYGFWGVAAYCIGIWLMMIVNNYWYLLCRTLMDEHFAWNFLPFAVYVALGLAMFVPDDSPVFDWFTLFGESFITGQWWGFLLEVLLILGLWLLTRQVMMRVIYREINKVEDTTVKVRKLSQYKFLDRYGDVGEYIKLELKMLLRNKMCKRSLYVVLVASLFFAAIYCFDEGITGFSKDFFVLYDYIICGSMFLVTLMGYEGNYMDGLMSRKESIYSLLKAKYVVYSAMQIIPTLMFVPAMVMGHITIWTCLGWMLFVPGVVYFGLFQLAVYNNKTIPLNVKLTGQQNTGTGLQNIIAAAVFFAPLLVLYLVQALVGNDNAPFVLMALGAVFILTAPRWIHNVYRRFMKRRYANMASFRDTRQR